MRIYQPTTDAEPLIAIKDMIQAYRIIGDTIEFLPASLAEEEIEDTEGLVYEEVTHEFPDGLGLPEIDDIAFMELMYLQFFETEDDA